MRKPDCLTKKPSPQWTNHWRWVKLLTLTTTLIAGVSCVPSFLKTAEKTTPVAEATSEPPKKEASESATPAAATTPTVPTVVPTESNQELPKGETSTPPVKPPADLPTLPNPGPFSQTKILQVGSRGDAVLALEKRLALLRYDVGAVDGHFDQQTWQGVVAFQKYAKLKRTGTYTLETQQALHKASYPEGKHAELGWPRIEIDIPRQVLLFFDEKGLNRALAVSSGSDRKYCEVSKKSGKQVCGVARTPRGRFHIQYRIPGWRESDLGKLFNPLYFNGGFAIHGAPRVPVYNASHGCIRISVASSKWFFDTVKNGTPVIVFD